MIETIPAPITIQPITHVSRFKWSIIAFIVAAIITTLLFVWQLWETTPVRWCAVATTMTDQKTTACVSVLLRLLDIKDHAVIGLLIILGATIISVTVVALGVKVAGSGPGGLNIDIGADKTIVENADGESSVQIPTPPSTAKDTLK